ncbi:MAG: cytochrome ubiquinol oxidase subunit I [Deltaproteobacteria bacterium]|nr:cytochrome ubiquinol oxidase subunit I [Nannocystaceae bacterium]
MAISLGFHILFAIAGMAMPVLMAAAQWRFNVTGEPGWRELADRWAKGTAILFAVGAVSGTVLSFELGLLWPEFMRHAGPLIGMPFSLEGFAFFLEAIFLGLYLYGRDRLSPRVHLACGVAVAICGMASAVFVTAVNAWMNEPTGLVLQDGALVDIDPWAAMRSAVFGTEALHVVLASYVAVGFAALGIHAHALLRRPGDPLHRRAFKLALVMAMVSIPLQVVSGDRSAKHIATNQPVKLAAAEGLFETGRGAPIALGGWPDLDARELRGAIEVPYVLSVLATGDPNGEVIGLNDIPRDEWPPVAIVHVAFDVMVGCGSILLAFAGWAAWIWWRRRPPPWEHRRLLVLARWVAPLGIVALEAGWVVTEVGRQPWIVRGWMRTADAVTPMPNLVVPLIGFTLLYFVLGAVVVVLLRSMVRQTYEEDA